MKYMLDTNICIYIINQRPKEVFARFGKYAPEDICISSVTLSELEYSVAKSNNIYRNRMALAGFLAPIKILPYTDFAAREFGQIRVCLEKGGMVIGAYDLQIAAHAKSENLVLVTNNINEFSRIDGLILENWVKKLS